MSSRLAPWLLLGLGGLLLLIWAAPHLFPLHPELAVTRLEAEIIGSELLRDLGPIPDNVYIVTDLESDSRLEGRLQRLVAVHGRKKVAASRPAGWLTGWRVTIFEPGDGVTDWLARAQIGTDGQILSLRRRTGNTAATHNDGADSGPLEDLEAKQRAMSYLKSLGLDDDFEREPEIRRVEQSNADISTLTYVRWSHGNRLFEGLSHGREVLFEGPELRGHSVWFEDADSEQIQSDLAQLQIVSMLQILILYLMLPWVVIWFLRLYHRGEFGVARGVRVAGSCLLASALALGMNASAISSSVTLGPISRRATTWLAAGFSFFFFFLGLSVLALTSWCVGEALCRRRWPAKLAALDAILRLRWDNATVARSSLLAWCGGLGMSGIAATLGVLTQPLGYWPASSFMQANGFDTGWPGISLVLNTLAMMVPLMLIFGLLIPSWALGRLGIRRGLFFAWLSYGAMMPLLVGLPLAGAWAQWMLVAAIPPLLFWFGDAAASIGAPLIASALLPISQLTTAATPSLQFQGWLAAGLIAAPLIASLRHLRNGTELVYSFENIPTHVRRIAERERQRLELETASEIQAAIMPAPPTQLEGLDVAHAYLPATEVGGDFFELRPVQEPRIMLAVGDVAGHGVSSGLVMSMVKAALRVQAEHAPEVADVMAQLNRQVHSGARRRLLTTLVYGLLNPRDGALVFACAGHPFPYRLKHDGHIEELHSVAYPLGVRHELKLEVRHAVLEPGDSLILYSDGLVEARAEGDEEPFGFERLETALKVGSGLAPAALRDSVLASLRAHTGGAAQDDDLTLLVIRRPS